MVDFALEILKAVVVGFVFFFLFTNKHGKQLASIKGWKLIICGFGLIFFGMLMDITDNFPVLDQFVLVGDTEAQALLEQVVGYLLGFSMLGLGVWRWIPNVVELQQKQQQELEASTRKVEELSKLLPICMDCKKTRNDEGYWNRIEEYLESHAGVLVSHGICDDCVEKRYSEMGEDRSTKI